MEEQFERPTRSSRRKKKRLRVGRLIFTIIFIFIIGVFIYCFIQYQNGLNIAKKGNKKVEVEQFIPDEQHHKITNYLLIGIDSREGEKSRSDTMMVLSWNKDTKELKNVSFMRDIYAEIPGYKGYKLNTAYFLGGVQLLKETLNTMFQIPIHHYAIVDFNSFESLIDIIAPDGIEIDVEKDMSANIDVSLTKGEQKLNGKELLGYARFRKDAEGDFGRVRRQQQVINALKEQVLTPTNALKLPKFAGALQGYVTTDLTTAEELKLALSVLISGTSNIEKLTIPVEGHYRFASYAHAGSVIVIDLEENKKQLHNFLGI